GAGGDLVGAEFLAAPGTENDVRGAGDDLAVVGQDAVPGQRLRRPFRKDVVAAGDAHQFGHPLDAADARLVPFLEIYLRPPRQLPGPRGNRLQPALELARPGLRPRRGADQGAQAADVVEDAGDAAMVADPDLDPVPHQLGGDIGLDVGEADHEIRLQLEDLPDLRRGEGADLGLFLARPRRPHREAADANDALLLAQGVQDLGRLLGQADDAARADAHGYSIRFCHWPSRRT